MRRSNNLKIRLGFLIFLVFVGCSAPAPQVVSISQPDYPAAARSGNIQGVVEVWVSIGADGRVLVAKGSGAHDYLVKAAEDNAKTWKFGPFPRVATFPMETKITYDFRLIGNPVGVSTPPTVTTHLPDRIEIVAVRVMGDTVTVVP